MSNVELFSNNCVATTVRPVSEAQSLFVLRTFSHNKHIADCSETESR
jgi:hypothetical protein